MDTTGTNNGHVLVTGGAGYIGSHTVVSLLEDGYKVVVLDDLSNSFKTSLDNVRKITQCAASDLIFHKRSLQDRRFLESVFAKYNITAVIHFAGHKSVSESFAKPLVYYHNNVISTCVLLETMRKFHCKRLVFSSSATVYGNAAEPYI